MRRASQALFAAALLGVLGACGPEAPPTPTGRVRSFIQGGYDDPDDTAVVAILHVASGSLCSGSLLAPNAVLTARHCVAPVIGDPGAVDCGSTRFGFSYPPAGFFVTTAEEVTPGNAGEYLVAEVIDPPDADGLFCGSDVAMLVLDDNVDPSRATPLVPRVDEPLVPGETYSAVGYGAVDEEGSDPGFRRRRDDLAITCVGDACGESQVKSNEWVGNGGICSGDSGGPSLDVEGRVTGITSRGDYACTLSLYGSTVAWADWLKDSVVHASGMGLYEAPSWTAGSTVNPEHSMPVGDACTSADDCPTGRCIQDAGRSFCTRPCDAEHGCPDGYVCGGSGENVCVREPPPQPLSYQRPDKEGCAAAPGTARGSWLWLAVALAVGRRRARRSPQAISL